MPIAAHIDLLRHGETGHSGFCGRCDDALSARGLEQMRAATRTAGPWRTLVTSPLRRCAAFARELATRSGLDLHIEARLRELDFGAWEGRSADDVHATEPEALGRFWADPYRYPPPGGEPLIDFERRVLQGWRALLEHRVNGPILVITHAGVIRMIRRHEEGLPTDALLRLDVAHASLHRIRRPRECA